MTRVFFHFWIFFVLPLACYGINLNANRLIALPSPQNAIATGDLNRDSIPDIVLGGDPVTAESGKVRVFLGKGNGNFSFLAEYTVGVGPGQGGPSRIVTEIEIGDLNNDGALDVVVAHNSSTLASSLLATILLGNGDGTLQRRDALSFFNGPGYLIRSLELADFNADGMTDVLLAGGNTSGGLGRIFGVRNLGGGNFQAGASRTVGPEIMGMESADLNRDGYADVVLATFEGILILYGQEDVFYTWAQELGDTSELFGLAVEDFNADGMPDIAVSELRNPRLRIFLSRFGRLPEMPIVIPTAGLLYLKSSDVNADAKKDLIGIHGTGQLQILYGDGGGAFPETQNITTNLPVSDIAVSDLDLDGKPDLACSLANFQNSNQSAIFLNAPNPRRYYSDFDGDAAADPTIFRPGTGEWWTLMSNDFSFRSIPFGLPSDKLIPGNYDDDRKTDIAVFRNGVWYILQSSNVSVRFEHWGLPDDVPVPADYDNDGIMNVAVFRRSDGMWYIKRAAGFSAIHWGLSTDIPVDGDYDGDGLVDIAVFRPTDGTWYIRPSNGSSFIATRFGSEGDRPVRGDFDGDGKTDTAVFRPSDGYWYIRESSSGNVRYVPFGSATDFPVPADFDGDTKDDVAVFRPNLGVWYVLRSSDSASSSFQWGAPTDRPAATDLVISP